ncbi:MAG: hypothetical protein COU27_01145 [Candidatus Levybacteria bacterium CG10_big_fil_rev_8_21_14_0_10_36_7]|nr:MAG: hypothetical protein COU27_01145 [Candidatus Levybacteria bacterium CG10_big_fil_rev_8_21_14_0_10_36_7]
MYKVKLETFEGPLDLLLQLIEQNKLEITEISLASVTEQYLTILHDNSENIGAGDLADFLVTATKLLVIKSKALLPYLIEEEEEDEEDLARQLKIYKEFFEASKRIQRILARKKFGFSRQKFFTPKETGFHPPEGLTGVKMKNIFSLVIDDLRPAAELPKNIIRRTINIQEKIQRIRDMIAYEVSVNFKKILIDAKDKTDVIVSFLAILELTKQRTITVDQDKIFSDITIKRI